MDLWPCSSKDLDNLVRQEVFFQIFPLRLYIHSILPLVMTNWTHFCLRCEAICWFVYYDSIWSMMYEQIVNYARLRSKFFCILWQTLEVHEFSPMSSNTTFFFQLNKKIWKLLLVLVTWLLVQRFDSVDRLLLFRGIIKHFFSSINKTD